VEQSSQRLLVNGTPKEKIFGTLMSASTKNFITEVLDHILNTKINTDTTEMVSISIMLSTNMLKLWLNPSIKRIQS